MPLPLLKVYCPIQMTEPYRKPLPTLEEALKCPLLEGNLEQWIRCCTARFLPVARRVAGDDAHAHDALHESWVLVIQRLYHYKGGPPACSWVRAIVRHEALHGAQARAKEGPLNEEALAVLRSTEGEVYRAELRSLLLEAIDHLPPTFREVVQLRDIEERSNAEVAERLHISKRNVAVRLHRAHQRLRSMLTESAKP